MMSFCYIILLIIDALCVECVITRAYVYKPLVIIIACEGVGGGGRSERLCSRIQGMLYSNCLYIK